ncbi:hypothetical protein [Gaoshiqia sp. Z1-71]|uniref:hypothetical protein n=1 Tax=Gaoshiqia hydrogeniformans TaxID=3290090 RepID=UPI003BF89A37
MKQIQQLGLISSIFLILFFAIIGFEKELISPLILLLFIVVLILSVPINKPSKKIIISFFLFYSGWGLLIALSIISDPLKDYYNALDSTTFYKITETFNNVKTFESFIIQFKKISLIYQDTLGWNLLLAINASIANIIDKNNIYIHIILNSFIGGLCVQQLYVLIKNNLEIEKAKKWTYLLGIFSFIPIFTPTLLRDVLILFMFLLAYNTVLPKQHLWIVKILIIALITSFIRPESGIVVLGFLILLLRQVKLSTIFISLIAIIFLLPLILNYFEKIKATYETYIIYSEELNDSSGLGQVLFSLPIGFRELFVSVYSQIQPFPSINAVNEGFNANGHSVFRIYEIFAGIFHLALWSFIIYSISVRRIRKSIPFEYYLLLILTLTFLAGSIYTFSHRRAMSLYPSIYICAIWCYYKLTPNERKYLFSLTIITMISLNLAYYLIK